MVFRSVMQKNGKCERRTTCMSACVCVCELDSDMRVNCQTFEEKKRHEYFAALNVWRDDNRERKKKRAQSHNKRHVYVDRSNRIRTYND